MPDRATNRDFAARALEAITRIQSARDAPNLLERLMNATAAIGATSSLYTAAIPESESETSSFSLFACHPGFAYRQDRLGSLLDHPWFRFASTHSAPGTDQQLRLQHASDAAAIELARQYGFRSCFIVPVPSSAGAGRFEMLCLGSSSPSAFEGEDARILRTLARALAAELHDWVTRYLSERLQAIARLHDADIELLRLEQQGLGTKEISLRTGLTRTSVNSRFQRLNARLACPNRKASARKAAVYGLLDAT